MASERVRAKDVDGIESCRLQTVYGWLKGVPATFSVVASCHNNGAGALGALYSLVWGRV